MKGVSPSSQRRGRVLARRAHGAETAGSGTALGAPHFKAAADETSEAEACAGIAEDIAELARKLAETEPYKSASGPEALLALASHLDEMVASDRVGQPGVIRVAIRKKQAR